MRLLYICVRWMGCLQYGTQRIQQSLQRWQEEGGDGDGRALRRAICHFVTQKHKGSTAQGFLWGKTAQSLIDFFLLHQNRDLNTKKALICDN